MRGAVVAILLTLVTTARADTVSDSDAADTAFVEGRALIAANKPKEACERFHAANELDPNAVGILLNLGLCYEQQGLLASAIKWYRKAQLAASEHKDPASVQEYEDAAKAATSRLAGRVATIKVVVSNLPADAVISVDDRTFDRTDVVLEVDRGTHVFEAKAAGKRPSKTSVEVLDGDSKTLNFERLADVSMASPRGPRRLLGLSVAIGSIVIAGVATGLYANGVQNEYNDPDTGGTDGDGHLRKLQIAGGVFIATSLVGVAIGGYLFFRKPKADASAIAVAPIVTHENLGIAVSRRF